MLALAYNRHAAAEIRRRLEILIGGNARGVTVLTCHGFAMRLVGASFAGRAEPLNDDAFRDVMKQAVALLRGRGLPPEDAVENRARLLSGFRWVLVDEHQDVGPEQYELIAAIAGRSLEDGDERLGLFTVRDDDQNVYAFSGASVRFIRRFEQDYGAGVAFLMDNYRSTAHIVVASNTFIEPDAGSMKRGVPSTSTSFAAMTRRAATGSDWERLDPLAKGRVQILPVRGDAVVQAQAAVMELQRLAALSPDWDWSRCAVIARNGATSSPFARAASTMASGYSRRARPSRVSGGCEKTQVALASAARRRDRPGRARGAHGVARRPAPRTVDQVAGRYDRQVLR